jgi:hypothetical protein
MAEVSIHDATLRREARHETASGPDECGVGPRHRGAVEVGRAMPTAHSCTVHTPTVLRVPGPPEERGSRCLFITHKIANGELREGKVRPRFEERDLPWIERVLCHRRVGTRAQDQAAVPHRRVQPGRDASPSTYRTEILEALMARPGSNDLATLIAMADTDKTVRMRPLRAIRDLGD